MNFSCLFHCLFEPVFYICFYCFSIVFRTAENLKTLKNQVFCIRHFSKTDQQNKKKCNNSSSFCIDFSLKIMTFSVSKSAWIFVWFFHWKWLPKVSHFQWKKHPKNKTFSEPLNNRFFCVLGALRDSARWPYSFFFSFFWILDRNWLPEWSGK